MDAVDFISAPDPNLLAQLGVGALPYTGNARPTQAWFDQCRALGVPILWMTQETYSTRSQEGFAAGVADCRYAEARAQEVGHVGPIAVVVSDGNGADAWDASQYGAGWASVASHRFFPYGAVAVCASFIAGASSSPFHVDGEWVPETWGAGRIAAQVVGPSPVPDTDLNHIYLVLVGDDMALSHDDIAAIAAAVGGQDQALWGKTTNLGDIYNHIDKVVAELKAEIAKVSVAGGVVPTNITLTGKLS